ncbi:ligand-gated ion-channel protein [Chloropicon primus]|nr:ligand-gated ion-channel protein [Chloropicon primus]UPR02497.1 ligand-gated ion-channel protein [Chloropicon primus]|eukprot:QDZ23285.1 ligand-gated ion-channel protein [Chloropicon primus]
MSLPFTGQGDEPEEPVEVYVSAMMERLLEVDDKNYLFENIVYVYLSWEDERAYQQMIDATDSYRNGTLEECERPCSSDSQGSLSRRGTGYHHHDTCCSTIWLPTIEMLNVYELPEGRLQPYGIIKDEGSSGVAWWVGIHGKYFTPMDFRRFPFDHQELDMQFSFTPEVNPAIKRFIPSATSTRFLIRGEGDALSGFEVAGIKIVAKKESLQDELDFFIGGYGTKSNPNDPVKITGGPARSGYLGQAERVSFDIFIGVDRFSKYYVLNMIVPVLLLVSLSFITYIIPPSSLDSRIGLNVTLFLALTALQFVVNDQLPKSSYPTAVTELILVCYLVVSFGVPESIVVFALEATMKAREDKLMKSIKDGEEVEGMASPKSEDGLPESMSIAMRVLKRKRSQKAPFIIDMVSLAVMIVIVIVASTIILVGVPSLMPDLPDRRQYD